MSARIKWNWFDPNLYVLNLPHPVDHKLATKLFQQALDLEEAGCYQAAIEHYHQALLWHPELVSALVNIANLLWRLKRADEAEKYCRQALRVDPGYYLAHYNLGCCLEELGRYTKAIWYYRETLRLKPRHADSYY